MWIVQLALRRPYTFVVMALLIVLMGGLAILRMPADIFPEINIPVVSVIWSYGGISAGEMAQMVTVRTERSYTTAVNDIEHMESQSLTGLGIIKMFFHPSAKIEAAVAQVTANSQGIVHYLPPGMSPPAILRYNASAVPILQLIVTSDTISEQVMYDYGHNFIRTQMATVQGASFPLPYGGRQRQIMVDLEPKALYAMGLTPYDVVNAVNSQSLTQPSGSARMGTREYNVRLNNSPAAVELFNEIPIRRSNGATILMRDVATVRDGYAVQTNIVRHDGRRSILMTVLKNGGASTLDIVARLKAILPRIRATLPADMDLKLLFDQSIFVRSAISGVIREAILAAFLTGLMILLFLGSWRSTVIVCISIPLSILTSLAVLYLMGQTINAMTLGGLALAVGILVDDATVEIENIHRNLGEGRAIVDAILTGAQQIAVPAFVSTLCICIVFVPVIFLTGAARYLFMPLALAVVLAMAASYILSRTLIPTMVKYMIPAEVERYRGPEGHGQPRKQSLLWKAHHKFDQGFERMRVGYRRLVAASLHHRGVVSVFFLTLCFACVGLIPWIGADFFPKVDAGQIRFHVRAPAGTRIEETERIFAGVEDVVRQVIPKAELSDILDNIGLPYSGINIAYSDSVTLGSFDGEILVSLKPGEHGSTWEYVRHLREKLNRTFPEVTFFFQPADIVGQILNFGVPAPIDIQIAGPLKNYDANYKIAREIEARVARLPGAVDVHMHQVDDVPEMRIDVDRTRANQFGISQQDVARNTLVSLASSSYVATNWWLNPINDVDYLVAVQTPTYRLDSTDALMQTPIRSTNGTSEQLLGNIAGFSRSATPAVVSHYNVQPMLNLFANVQDRDLGSLSRDVDKVLSGYQSKIPKGSTITVRGQVETMRTSFVGLGLGMILAIVLVYFVMVVNFQSWLDPFIILMALPGALAGILLMLFLTQTTLSVPSMMGAIMSIGVATANSILLVNFANDLRQQGLDAKEAALEAAHTRLRPVVMTAAAMIIGMLPMALGIGEGGEQNAPLGRAVIGGLLVATIATLFFVPVVYSKLRATPPKDFDMEVPV
ncbi:MAG: efflux RND transporter permease subunit [Bryobacteraceae bacterium]